MANNEIDLNEIEREPLEVLPNTIILHLSNIYSGVRVLGLINKSDIHSAAEHNKGVNKNLTIINAKCVKV